MTVLTNATDYDEKTANHLLEEENKDIIRCYDALAKQYHQTLNTLLYTPEIGVTKNHPSLKRR